MGRPFKCPYCGATESVSKGVRKTKTMGARRIRRCASCERKFTPRSQKPAEPGSSAPASETPTAAPPAESSAAPPPTAG